MISNEHELPESEEEEQRADQLLQSSEIAKILFKEDGLKIIANPKTSIFRTSDRFSTYLMAIVAGPFDFHERNTPGMPPMRIYARKTVFDALTLSHDEMFNVTQAGIRFY